MRFEGCLIFSDLLSPRRAQPPGHLCNAHWWFVNGSVTDKKTQNTNNHACCNDVTDRERGNRRQ